MVLLHYLPSRLSENPRSANPPSVSEVTKVTVKVVVLGAIALPTKQVE